MLPYLRYPVPMFPGFCNLIVVISINCLQISIKRLHANPPPRYVRVMFRVLVRVSVWARLELRLRLGCGLGCGLGIGPYG